MRLHPTAAAWSTSGFDWVGFVVLGVPVGARVLLFSTDRRIRPKTRPQEAQLLALTLANKLQILAMTQPDALRSIERVTDLLLGSPPPKRQQG